MESKLWYQTPAACFEEALPLGNGSLGAMVYGRTDMERISLNHDTFWSGTPLQRLDADTRHVFEKARSLTLEGELEDAATVLREGFLTPHGQSCLPLGNLFIRRLNALPPQDYYRELDLETATVTVRYRDGSNQFTQEVFTSYPDNCLVLRIRSDTPADYALSMDTQVKGTSTVMGDALVLATVPNVPERSHRHKNQYIRSSGLRYIDLCQRLGAEDSDLWSPGLLSKDNVHPTEDLGTTAIAGYITDALPEIRK